MVLEQGASGVPGPLNRTTLGSIFMAESILVESREIWLIVVRSWTRVCSSKVSRAEWEASKIYESQNGTNNIIVIIK